MSKLKIGLNVATIKYTDGKREYWYEGMIMGFKPHERNPTHVKLQPVQEGSRMVELPIEDIALVKDLGKGRYIPLDEYEPPNSGRKLKPDGTKLPSDYTGRKE